MVADEGLVLAELMCARLCHDLAGSINAVGTGAELLADEDLSGDALALLVASAATAGHRLKFLRIALGSGGAPIPARQMRDMVEGFLASPLRDSDKVRLDWQVDDQAPWPADPAKLLLNLVLLAKDCLKGGGALVVRTGRPGASLISAAAAGKGAAPGEAAAGLTAPGLAGLGPRGVQGYYAARLAGRCGTAISHSAVVDLVVFTTS
jgi:histidine phosphotransferase ChpT